MHPISMKKLRQFWEEHPDAQAPLRAWYKIAEQADWQNFSDLKRTAANSVDQVGDCVVFNIRGNNYRLVVKIDYVWKRIFIKHVLTHKDYDRGSWKKDC